MMSGRGRRVLVYTAGLLLSPVPAMAFERGTRGFAWAVGAWGLALGLASFYTARGELRLKARGLLGQKLVAASLITLACGAAVVIGAAVYLVRTS